jgi:multidrug efflux pump
MLSNFFVERPVFAAVISIIIVFAGLVALKNLPLEEYPSIDPPLIQVTASYPGANASTISTNVAALLEREINGIEKMIYMSSESSSSGQMNLSVFFEVGTDVNMAQINVQNRVNAALPHLPYEVQRNGVTVKKQSPNFLMMIAVTSPGGRFSDVFTSNYVSLNIIDELLRVDGVSEASIFGAREYSMRLWLKPDLMSQLKITVEDILSAVREQNADYAIGQIGQPPTEHRVDLTLPVSTQGRLSHAQDFENIILRSNIDGSQVLLKDVARVELGAQNYDVIAELNGQPTTLIAVHQQIGSKQRWKGFRSLFLQGLIIQSPIIPPFTYRLPFLKSSAPFLKRPYLSFWLFCYFCKILERHSFLYWRS